MAKQSGKDPNKNNNPTGRGGFGDHPESRNTGGAPRKGESVAEAVRYFLDTEVDEQIVNDAGEVVGTERCRRIALLIKCAFEEAITARKAWAFRWLAIFGYGYPTQSTEQAAAGGMSELLDALEAADRVAEDSEAIKYLKETFGAMNTYGNGNGSRN